MSAALDVLVVGGGPAGAAAAALLAEDGLSVVLLERERFPRDKVCGEFIASRGVGTLERLGVLDELLRAGARRIDRCRLSSSGGKILDAGLPDPHPAKALGVSRALLDEALLRRAAANGADVRERCQVRAPRFNGERVRGVSFRVRGETRDHHMDAKVVIAADGRRSALGAALHPALGDPGRSGPSSRFGLKAHLEGRPLDGGRVELHLFDGGYAGLAAIEGGRLNLCLLLSVRALRAAGGSPERVLAEPLRANPALAESLAQSRVAGRWHSVGPLRFAVRRPATRGVLFAGDAAGTIDPFCGGGIAHALGAAELLRPFAREAVARGGLVEDVERAYAAAWHARFAPATRRVRRLGWLFERPRIAGVILAALRGPAQALAPTLVAAARTG